MNIPPPSTRPLSADEQITVSMASIPERMVGMLATLEQMLPYCDNFDVCLNGYPYFDHPLFRDPRVRVFFTPPEVGARGKFYMNARTPGYHLTIDDDIQYPDDYIQTMVKEIERFDRAVLVGVHGQILTYPVGRVLLNYALDQDRDWPAHIIGTGTLAYHSDRLSLNWNELLPGKIDDQVAFYAQEHQIPMCVVAHRGNWIRDRPELSNLNALRHNIPLRREADDRIRQHNWRLYVP